MYIKEFNKYFASLGTAFGNASMEHKEFSFQEFQKAFKTLKRNKAIGCDGLKGNIIVDVYDSLEAIFLQKFYGIS